MEKHKHKKPRPKIVAVIGLKWGKFLEIQEDPAVRSLPIELRHGGSIDTGSNQNKLALKIARGADVIFLNVGNSRFIKKGDLSECDIIYFQGASSLKRELILRFGIMPND